MSRKPVGWACPYCGPVKIVYSDRTEELHGKQNQD